MTGDFKIKHVYTKVQDFGEVKSTSYWAPTSHKRIVGDDGSNERGASIATFAGEHPYRGILRFQHLFVKSFDLNVLQAESN
ncbi:hypothetical protein CYMTET_38085 [Cymbomonas tetramitiformis]|uniref:Uncharacterized protein n=1 Tax=Cymbomonas tetramitiformis TaxID=36881 RepID=A0AAE0F5T6_9CHLO|nr:hypothetical protein CYMTET_38085 [Cymbomonas tetramitiformis]